MNKFNKITDSEWKIMKVLWKKGQLTASEIVEELQPETTWCPNTIRTLINRLVTKEFLGVKKEKINTFYPLVTRKECIKYETAKFIDKVYDGSIYTIISNFIENDKISKKDLKILKNFIKKQDSI